MSPWFLYRKNRRHFWSETTKLTVIQKFPSFYSCAFLSLGLSLLSTETKHCPIYTVSQRTEASSSTKSMQNQCEECSDHSEIKFIHNIGDCTRGQDITRGVMDFWKGNMHNVWHAVCALHFQGLAHENGIHQPLWMPRVQLYVITTKK